MRSVDEIRDSLRNLALLHGPVSEIVAKETSMLGLAYLDLDDPDYEQSFLQLRAASDMMHELELEEDEAGLDIDYRLGKAIESRATTNEQETEASQLLSRVSHNRFEWDSKNPPRLRDPAAPLEEEMDSTMCYYDEAYNDHAEGRLKNAICNMEKCVELRKLKFGEKSAALSTPLMNLADMLRESGNFQRAKACLRDAVAFSVKAYGRLDLKVAELLNSLGNLQRLCMEFSESEHTLMEALSIRKEVLGDSDVQVAASLNNIAELYRERGDFMNAIEWHKKAIAVFGASGGDQHPGTINAKGNYGVTLQRLAQLSAVDGNALLNEAIDFMHEKGYEKDHPWLSKFGNEYLLKEARKFAIGKQFELSIDLYNTLIKRKEQLIRDISVAGESDSNSISSYQPIQEDLEIPSLSSLDIRTLAIVEFERFETMLQWTQSLLDTSKYLEAMGNIKECEQFAVNRINDPPETQRDRSLSSQLIIVKAQLARVVGDFDRSLSLAKDAVAISEGIVSNEAIPITRPFLFLSDFYCELGMFKDAEVCCLKVRSKWF
jgi:tetratricopeptide (TPR) repeat protein